MAFAVSSHGQNALPDSSSKKLSVDSVRTPQKNELKSKVHYTAKDSIKFDISGEQVFLYGKAHIIYEDIDLEADYVEINWVKKELFAKGSLDSAGNDVGLPVFKQNADMFTSQSVTYNFDTRKGKIKQVITKQGDGYIHGESVKKIDDESYFIRKGAYTTCDNPHPHYSISSNKLKVIQNNKVVTGPAYLVIEDVPTPLLVPFGYFPTRKGRASGILFPSYGESSRLGFFFKDGGYYFGIGDVVDFAITGDIYTLGSWGMKLNSNYTNRYHYNGNVSISYSEIKESEPELPDYNLYKDFFIRWNHRQDPKARPNSNFSANVNFGSSGYYQNNISSATNYLTNTFQSSIAYSKNWTGKPYSFSGSLSHSQNTITKDVSMSLPNTNFSVNRLYPFKRREAVGEEKWYEKIGVSYQNNFQNRVQTKDSLLFKTSDQFQYGMSHAIPISTSFKAFKYFTLSPTFTYNERWYPETIRKYYDATTETVKTDTVSGFRSARDFILSASLNTRVYGMVQFKKGKIAALRHVLSPTVTYGYRPDFGNPNFNYYKDYQINSQGTTAQYSIFETGVYGSPPSGKYGVIGLTLDNNLEMKVRSYTDTTVNLKKIKIFESLAGGVSYNTAVDSLNWSLITLNGRTTLFERVNLNLSGAWDPYIVNSQGTRVNTFVLDANNKLARLVNATGSVGFNLAGGKKEPKTSTKGSELELEQINRNINDYIDFSIPFSLVVNYSVAYSKPTLDAALVSQTLNFYGDLSLTEKWKITFNSGYDFTQKDLSYTSLGIYRDLHCWEMKINWVPFGAQENYYFQINIKSSVLQDLKLSKKNDIYDR